MSKLETGMLLPDFTYDTPFAKGLALADTAKAAPKTALVFLRYYGCTLCQYDIHRMAEGYGKISANGGQLLVVLQSDPAGLAKQITPDDLPFAIVCDPDQALYQQFEIAPAESMEKMIDPETMLKIAKAKAGGFRHGEYEGNELQLPAVFVVDSDRRLTYVHYGVSAGDIPSVEELAQLLS